MFCILGGPSTYCMFQDYLWGGWRVFLLRLLWGENVAGSLGLVWIWDSQNGELLSVEFYASWALVGEQTCFGEIVATDEATP